MVSTSLSCAATKYGAGHHEAEISLLAAQMNLKFSYINLFFYTPCTATTKISICLFYLRIFHPERQSRFLIYSCIVFISIISFVFTIFNTFQCNPISTYWDFALRASGRKCIDSIPVFHTAGVCNIVSELWLIAIIFPRIINLRINQRQKTALIIVVSLGWLVVIASLIRLIRISKLLHDQDRTWSSYDVTIWTGVEVNVGLICASGPAIKPLLNRIMLGLMGSLTPHLGSSPYGRGGTSTFENASTRKSGAMFGSRFEMHSRKMERTVSQTDLAGNRLERSEWTVRGGGESTDVESMEDGRDAGQEGGIVKTTSVLVTSFDHK